MKFNGEINLATKTASEVNNNSIFIDVADNKLKFKDNSGNVGLFSSSVPWFLNSDAYDVYDDFESYSVGAFTTNTNWTITTQASTTASIASSTNAGGTGKELVLTGASISTGGNYASATTNLLGANKHSQFKIYCVADLSASVSESCSCSITFGGAGSFNLFTVNGGRQYGAQGTCLSEIQVVAKGSNVYDGYIGGKKVVADANITSLTIKASGGNNNSTARTTITVYVDDVRQSKLSF